MWVNFRALICGKARLDMEPQTTIETTVNLPTKTRHEMLKTPPFVCSLKPHIHTRPKKKKTFLHLRQLMRGRLFSAHEPTARCLLEKMRSKDETSWLPRVCGQADRQSDVRACGCAFTSLPV